MLTAVVSCIRGDTWWRHQMETFSALLTLCAGNFTGPGIFPAQRPVTRSFDVFFDMRLNKRLSKQPWGWWFETPSSSLWRQCNEYAISSWTVWPLGNVALGGRASGSSPNIGPGRAVDGDRTPTYRTNGGSCTLHSGGFSWNDLFWHVDLGSFHVVHDVTVYGTIENNYGKWYYQNNLFFVIWWLYTWE